MATQTETQILTQADEVAGAALQLPLMAAILKLMPVDERTREMQLMDEAEEAWIIDRLADLDAENPIPPF